MQTMEFKLRLINISTIFKSKFYLQAIQNSLVISLFSAVTSVIIAVIAAYSFTKFSQKIQNRLTDDYQYDVEL